VAGGSWRWGQLGVGTVADRRGRRVLCRGRGLAAGGGRRFLGLGAGSGRDRGGSAWPACSASGRGLAAEGDRRFPVQGLGLGRYCGGSAWPAGSVLAARVWCVGWSWVVRLPGAGTIAFRSHGARLPLRPCRL